MTWEHKSGDGRWKNHVNTETGEQSVKEHKLKVVQTWCAKDQHDYRITDVKKRIAECSKCKQEVIFVVGKHEIIDDKVLIS